MALNHLGQVVAEEWQHVATARRKVQLDAFVVMPNHVHGIIFIDNESDRATSTIVHAVTGKRSGTLQSGSLGAIVGHFKAAVSRRAKTLGLDSGQTLWQRNYYEHIMRNEKSLNEIRKYILENPAKWAEDDLYDG